MAELAPDHLPLPGDLDGDQIIERLAIHHRDLHAGPQPQRCDVPQPLRLALVNPVDLHRLTDRDVGERGTGELLNGAIGRRDRIAVGIDAGVSEWRVAIRSIIVSETACSSRSASSCTVSQE